MSAPRVLACGRSAVLVDCGEPAGGHGSGPGTDPTELARRLRVPGAEDVVPAARTVLVTCRTPAELPALRAAVEQVVQVARVEQVARGTGPDPVAGDDDEVVLDVAYDGPDLGEVARSAGLGVEELVRRHTATRWRVAFSGFVPGFGYLLPEGCDGDPGLPIVPRLDSPRPSVPAGSVALADAFCGVYPAASPGGWRLIGTTGARLWDPTARDSRGPAPALLRPGTAVRFRRVERVERPPEVGPTPPVVVDPALEVLAAGPGTLVQDDGRPGWAEVGVTASGFADRGAAALANRCVGNRSGAAVVEVLPGGLTLRALRPVVCAITGAEVALEVSAADGRSRLGTAPEVLALGQGATLRVGPPRRGARAVVAVRGGVDVLPELGSRSRDTLSRLGPAPLRAGELLGVGDAAAGPWADGWMAGAVVDPPPAGGQVCELHVVPGPREDWFAPEVWDVLAEPAEVGAHSDRVGLRLEPSRPLPRTRTGELPSEPMVRGAVQVPADGRPVIFGPDHPVTGGYPVVGVLEPESADRASQLLPGARVRLLRSRTRVDGYRGGGPGR